MTEDLQLVRATIEECFYTAKSFLADGLIDRDLPFEPQFQEMVDRELNDPEYTDLPKYEILLAVLKDFSYDLYRGNLSLIWNQNHIEAVLKLIKLIRTELHN